MGEPLHDWCVCSPFWPDVSGGETPFEAIARGLAERGTRFEDSQLHIVTCADSPGERGRPKFPFQLARRLYESGFPVHEDALPQHAWRHCQMRFQKAWPRSIATYTPSGCCCAGLAPL